MTAIQALTLQRRIGTFAAARFLRNQGWTAEDAVWLLARR